MVGGIDILASVASQNVTAFTYADNTSDQADDLIVEIADPARTWMQSYFPKKGEECESIIRVYNWNTMGDNRSFNCGTMWVDELSLAGPPNVVNVKAVSIPVITGIKTQKQYKFWENQPLQAVASEIAGLYGLALVWDTTESPTLDRSDIIDESHLEYLRDRCKDDGLNFKIFNRQLIIYSAEEYEAKSSVYTLTYGASQILSYSFVSRLNDTYASAENTFVSTKSGKLIEGKYEPPYGPEGTTSILKTNHRVEEDDDSLGEGEDEEGFRRNVKELGSQIDMSSQNAAAAAVATKKAKSHLREKNKKEKEGVIVVVGNPGYISGLNMDLVDFGNYDGKWFISSSIHSISEEGYVTELRLRAALQGY